MQVIQKRGQFHREFQIDSSTLPEIVKALLHSVFSALESDQAFDDRGFLTDCKKLEEPVLVKVPRLSSFLIRHILRSPGTAELLL